MMAVVSEKTGYPAEMLELTMALEADLGIGSLKRVALALQSAIEEIEAVKAGRLDQRLDRLVGLPDGRQLR